MKVVSFVIVFLWVLGCGKKEPVQPPVSNPEPTKPEAAKAEVTAGDKLYAINPASRGLAKSLWLMRGQNA